MSIEGKTTMFDHAEDDPFQATQLSVYLENRVGALAELCKLIAEHSINLFAICAVDTVEEAVVGGEAPFSSMTVGLKTLSFRPE